MAAASLVLALTACQRFPDSYPPPAQRHSVEELPSEPGSMMIEMDSDDVGKHIVKDIYDSKDESWRWTGPNPTLKTLIVRSTNLKFAADFAIWEEAFKQTGPLELSFYLNDRLIDKVRYTTPGSKHFEKAVQQNWVTVNSDGILSIRVDKAYVSAAGGLKFGVILLRIGLTQ